LQTYLQIIFNRCTFNENLQGERCDTEQKTNLHCSFFKIYRMPVKVKFRDMLYKSCITQVKDIDEKGVVSFYGSIFNTADRVKDIVDPGAYTKTISENFNEIQHYKNHDSTLMPGVIQKGGLEQDSEGLLSRSKLILDTQLGRETYEQYKAMAEAGKSMGHSIGYVPVRQQKSSDGFNHLKEVFLFEISTLTKMAAHPDALTVGIKSFEELDFEELVKEEVFYTNLLNCKFTDAKLENIELIHKHLQSLIETMRRQIAPIEDAPTKSIIFESNFFTNNLNL